LQFQELVLPSINDYRWLTGSGARAWLDEAAATDDRELVRLTAKLRRDLSVERVHLVIQQVDLRRRAREKFARADQMFFTAVGLEQSTDELIAAYKSRRFPVGSDVADLCCGIGGDLVSLSDRGPTLGVDRDPATAYIAEANCRSLGLDSARVEAVDVADVSLSDFAAWHIDPDRRPMGRRTMRAELSEPSPEVLSDLLTANPNGAFKLAPGAEPPDAWQDSGHLEWISSRRECRQLVAWLGSLAGEFSGQRSATMLRAEQPTHTITGRADVPVSAASQIGQFVFEPDPAVLAARLTGHLADSHNLAPISHGAVYLTADHDPHALELAAFSVMEVLPFDMRRLKQLLRIRQIGQLEIKQRGVQEDPAQLQKKLRGKGDERATLLLSRVRKQVVAILAKRV